MQQQSASNEPVYVISVASRLAALPCWVLRVLDQEGIVVPVRTDSNRRLYSDEDIAILARVRHWTEERGVNIAGVKVILEIENELRPKGADRNGVGSVDTLVSPDRGSALTVSPKFPLPALSSAHNSTDIK